MPRIVCPDGDTGFWSLLEERTVAAIQEHGLTLDWHNGIPSSDEEWLNRVGHADGIVLLWAIPDAVQRASRNLRVISWVGTGVGTSVNVPLATSLGIAVCNTPSYGNNAVAEHALGLMLALARDTVALDARIRAGQWRREEAPGFELAGKTVGVVGLGGIGTHVAQLCAVLGMRVLAWTPHPTPERLAAASATFAELPDLCAEADIVTLHLAHTAETIGIMSAALLARMRPTAYLVNTARATIVDVPALVAALREQRIAGAALDVFDQEPLDPADQLLTLPNVILTPHIGFHTPEASRRSITIAIDNLIGYFSGVPQNVVNPEVVR